MFGENVKVHFAGVDGWEIFHAAARAADVRYALYSCYRFIINKTIDDDLTLPIDHTIRVQDREFKHVIQDSGLFTLMFGKMKGVKQTRQSLEEWQDKLIKFVVQNNLNATCVEVDCQKVLGVEEAWYFRYRMREKLKNRQINVFHFEDGKKGLDRLIEFSDYLAISVPEMRILKPGTFKRDTRELVHYIKSRKPEIDIHLLGCTDFGMLRDNRHVTSADSTSWLQGVKYGSISDGKKKAHVDEFSPALFQERQEMIKVLLAGRGLEFNPKMLRYTTNASISATICKQRYEVNAGSQE